MLKDLKRSEIPEETARQLGFAPLTREELAQDFEDLPEDAVGYAIPCTDPRMGAQVRDEQGREVRILRFAPAEQYPWGALTDRYRYPGDAALHPFITQEAHAAFIAGSPVYVTAGAVPALCATIHGLPTIGLANYKAWYSPGTNALLPALRMYARPGSTWVLLMSRGRLLDVACIQTIADAARVLLGHGCGLRVFYLDGDHMRPGYDRGLNEHVLGPEVLMEEIDEAVSSLPSTDQQKAEAADIRADFLARRPEYARKDIRLLKPHIEQQTPLIRSEQDVWLGVLPRTEDLLGELSYYRREYGSGCDNQVYDQVLRVFAMRFSRSPGGRRELERRDIVQALELLRVPAPVRLVDDYLRAAAREYRTELARERARGRVASPTDGQRAVACLLEDIRHLLDGCTAVRVRTADVLAGLDQLGQRPWKNTLGGAPLTAQRLSKLLRSVGVHSRDAKMSGRTVKCYPLAALRHAIERHVEDSTPP